MIPYNSGAFGLNLISRFHGSAVYKACIPGFVSVIGYILLQWYYGQQDVEEQDLDHPYVIGVLVTAVSFLIIFRANHSYQRYWEACGAVHHMMSKFLDTTVAMASFHMQCKHYDKIRVPNFFDYPEVMNYNLTRDRGAPNIFQHNRNSNSNSNSNNNNGNSESDSDNPFDEVNFRSSMSINNLSQKYAKDILTSKKQFTRRNSNLNMSLGRTDRNRVHDGEARPQDADSETETQDDIDIMLNSGATPLLGEGRSDGGWNKLYDPATHSPGPALGFESRAPMTDYGETPSLFLQELAHLSSLLVAVAFSTLRNGDEGTESPLGIYIPGSDWPASDPDQMNLDEKAQMQMQSQTSFCQKVLYWLGMDRTPEYRAKYNAARPMLVLGGVSQHEIRSLQRAKGASAKTTLAWYWLSEFIGREHLAGSSGDIGPPIISRLFQFLSDGMIYYNHGRKIMFIPFPFPHAQLSAIFILVMVLTVPFMMNQFVNAKWLGGSLCFLLVTCLSGLHEVGRELENPFKNTPNDVPLCTLLAMYNEALLSMCSGFHPDGYWNDELDRRRYIAASKQQQTQNDAKQNTKQTQSTSSIHPNGISDAHVSELRLTIEKQAIELQELRALFEESKSTKKHDVASVAVEFGNAD